MEDQKVETQTIPQGPVASQVAIKMLGTNGGGFFNANAAHPYENPTPLSNFIQMLSIFLIPSGLTYYLGRKVKNQKHGWAVWAAMAVLFLSCLPGLLVGRERREPTVVCSGCCPRERKHGRKGSPVRDFQLRPICYHYHGRFLRCSQFNA